MVTTSEVVMRVGEVTVIRALRNVLGMRSICGRVWELSLDSVMAPVQGFIHLDRHSGNGIQPHLQAKKIPQGLPHTRFEKKFFFGYVYPVVFASKQAIHCF